ncbi:MAG: hypothetical protein JJU28_24315 [Cyclobacteriaceae bacterium]|nr:hypothetical protein [Cyclobacteriaceae bacterium]
MVPVEIRKAAHTRPTSIHQADAGIRRIPMSIADRFDIYNRPGQGRMT